MQQWAEKTFLNTSKLILMLKAHNVTESWTHFSLLEGWGGCCAVGLPSLTSTGDMPGLVLIGLNWTCNSVQVNKEVWIQANPQIQLKWVRNTTKLSSSCLIPHLIELLVLPRLNYSRRKELLTIPTSIPALGKSSRLLFMMWPKFKAVSLQNHTYFNTLLNIAWKFN